MPYAALFIMGLSIPFWTIVCYMALGFYGALLGTAVAVGTGVYIGRQAPEHLEPPLLTVACGAGLATLAFTALTPGGDIPALLLAAVKTIGRVYILAGVSAFITRRMVS